MFLLWVNGLCLWGFWNTRLYTLGGALWFLSHFSWWFVSFSGPALRAGRVLGGGEGGVLLELGERVRGSLVVVDGVRPDEPGGVPLDVVDDAGVDWLVGAPGRVDGGVEGGAEVDVADPAHGAADGGRRGRAGSEAGGAGAEPAGRAAADHEDGEGDQEREDEACGDCDGGEVDVGAEGGLGGELDVPVDGLLAHAEVVLVDGVGAGEGVFNGGDGLGAEEGEVVVVAGDGCGIDGRGLEVVGGAQVQPGGLEGAPLGQGDLDRVGDLGDDGLRAVAGEAEDGVVGGEDYVRVFADRLGEGARADLPDRARGGGQVHPVHAEAEEAGGIVLVLGLLVGREGDLVVEGAVVEGLVLVEDGRRVAVPLLGEGGAPVVDLLLREGRVAACWVLLHRQVGCLRVVGQPAGLGEDGDGGEGVEVQVAVVLGDGRVDEHVEQAVRGRQVGGLALGEVGDGGWDDAEPFLLRRVLEVLHELVRVLGREHGRAEVVVVRGGDDGVQLLRAEGDGRAGGVQGGDCVVRDGALLKGAVDGFKVGEDERVRLRQGGRGLGDGVDVRAEVLDLAPELERAGDAEDGGDAPEGEEARGDGGALLPIQEVAAVVARAQLQGEGAPGLPAPGLEVGEGAAADVLEELQQDFGRLLVLDRRVEAVLGGRLLLTSCSCCTWPCWGRRWRAGGHAS